MILSDIEAFVRLDLFDPTSGTPRWSNADLDRAIDRAVERYSIDNPNINWVDMNTQTYQRTYPYPAPANANYPVLWIERVIYPLQVYGSALAAPSAGPDLAQGSAGNVNGTVQYAVTLLTPGGETPAGPAASITVSNRQVQLSQIPLGPASATSSATILNTVIGRNLYRTKAGGSTFFLLACLRDNETTTYTDNIADTGLDNQPQPPSVNTSGVMYWPPRECIFGQFGNLLDTFKTFAASGNMGAQGAAGSPTSQSAASQRSFTLSLDNDELPCDNTLVMRIFYATRHQLDSNGSTIPAAHISLLTHGACAYAIEAYQTPTNDNFTFQDGTLRDRIDDTAISKAWLAAADRHMSQFEAGLRELKIQRNLASSLQVSWGQIPSQWRYI